MNNFFQKERTHIFWNLDFLYLSREKKATEKYCLHERSPYNEKKKKSVYPLSNIVHC